jgi:hypothetical protein
MQFAFQNGETAEAASNGGFLTDFMWLVPLLPFVAFFAILFFGKRMKDGGHTVGILAVGIGWVVSLWGFIELAAGN